MPEVERASRWLRSQPECGQRPDLRVVCFPPAGGGATSFEPLFRVAGPETECLGVELPGHLTRLREPCAEHIKEWFSALASTIAETVADDTLPYVLLGQCMGAIVAYEVAARLEDMSVTPPAHLVAAGSNAPQDDPLRIGDPVAFLRATGNPDELFEIPELLDLTLGILGHDVELLDTYRCAGRVLTTPVTVVYGDADPYVNRAGLPGWKAVGLDVSLSELPGGHSVLDQHYGPFLRRLRDRIGHP